MNPASEDIKDILASIISLNLVFGTSLFIGKMPAKPLKAVVIYDTPGYPPAMAMDANTYFYDSVQIKVRDVSYTSASSLINSIAEQLHGRAQETWNGTLYSSIQIANGPHFLNWDENGYPNFIVNLNLQRR